MKKLLLLLFVQAFLISCIATSTYSSSMSNGMVKQELCFNGKCQKLLGLGRIYVNAGMVTVQCNSGTMFQYDYTEYKGYNCYNDEFIE